MPWWKRDPKIELVYKKHTRYFAHDEYELCAEGDMATPTPLS